MHFSRAADAVIRVYDGAGNVIETHEHHGDFREPCTRLAIQQRFSQYLGTTTRSMSSQQIINSIGLICNIVGACLVWRFGLPANIGPAGRRYLQTGIIEPQDAAAARRNHSFSTLGFILFCN